MNISDIRAGSLALARFTFFFVAVAPHRVVLDVPALFASENTTTVSRNHTPEHIRSAAPTDKYQKSYIEIMIAVFFGRTR